MGALDAVAPVAKVEANDRRSMLQAARQLEAALVQQMLSAMEKAQLEGGLFGHGPQTQGLEGTFDHLMSKAMSEEKGLGLAEKMVDQWTLNSAKTPARPGVRGDGRIRPDALPPARLASGPQMSRFFQVPAQVHPGPVEELKQKRSPVGSIHQPAAEERR